MAWPGAWAPLALELQANPSPNPLPSFATLEYIRTAFLFCERIGQGGRPKGKSESGNLTDRIIIIAEDQMDREQSEDQREREGSQ